SARRRAAAEDRARRNARRRGRVVSRARHGRGAAAARLERSGLLVVDKPAGVTSHDVVELVRRRLPAPGAGHLGTLDPGATGLLLIAIGAATRCASVWQGGEKTYEATLRLGVTTASQDLSGEVLTRVEPRVNEAEVRSASAAFTGDF